MKRFSESQRFNQWWLWVVIIGISFLPVYIGLGRLANGEHDSLIMELALSIAVSSGLILLMRLFCLKTTIDEQGISYQFYPIQSRPVTKTWSDISEISLKSYEWKEYGGWGMRYSSRNGDALNISGNTGLQIIFKNGKKLLIGTRQKSAVEEILKYLELQHKTNVSV